MYKIFSTIILSSFEIFPKTLAPNENETKTFRSKAFERFIQK